MDGKHCTDSTEPTGPEEESRLSYRSSLEGSPDYPDLAQGNLTHNYHSMINKLSLHPEMDLEVWLKVGAEEVMVRVDSVEGFRSSV